MGFEVCDLRVEGGVQMRIVWWGVWEGGSYISVITIPKRHIPLNTPTPKKSPSPRLERDLYSLRKTQKLRRGEGVMG